MKSKVILLFLLCLVAGQTFLFCQVNNDTTYKTLKNDYYEKEKMIGLNENSLDRLYRYKVNINAYKQFKKIGVDLYGLSYQLAGAFNFQENSLFSDLVIVGSVIKVEYDTTKFDWQKKTFPAFFKTTFTIQVNEVLLGNDLYPNQPEQVLLKREGGFNVGSSLETVHFVIGEKYIFFLTRKPLENIKELLHSSDPDVKKYLESEAHTYPGDDVLDNKFIFVEVVYSTLSIKSGIVYDRFGKLKPDLNSIKKTIRKIDTINDRANFYNRDYKIKKRNKILKIF
ncbi:MAG TPA: hypothetical protein PLP19_18355 [bacterium]|nr:hypothetical protein [bacterium]HPN45460.1 hypothetical protein [bacterium]